MEHAPEEAFVEVNRVLDIQGTRLELLKTLADCTGTRLYYQGDRSARLVPRPIWPPELLGSMSAGGGDVTEATFAPVLSDRKEIKVAFVGRFGGEPKESESITLPVDRGRTARFDRALEAPRPNAVTTDGVDLELTAARVGLLEGEFDLRLRGRDPTVLAFDLGWPFHHLHLSGDDSDPLWNDWRPDDGFARTATTERDGITTVSMSSSFTVTASTRRSRPRTPSAPVSRPPEPPDPVSVLALPERTQLSNVTAYLASGKLFPPIDMRAMVNFSPPATSTDGLELVVSGLYVLRSAASEPITVPLPAPGEDLDLDGHAFETEQGTVELLRWEAGFNELPTLVVRPPSPFWYPDVRVIHGDRSASLWMRPGHSGTVTGGLTAMYREAFEDPAGVRLGLRLLGKPAPTARIEVALGPPRA